MKNQYITLCPYCGSETRRIGEDGIDVCPECDQVVEGSTIQALLLDEDQEKHCDVCKSNMAEVLIKDQRVCINCVDKIL
jgi:hypothetical protein